GCLPRRLRVRRGVAAIGDDLDIAVGEQHVHEHAVVALGVPYPQQTEHFERTFARRRPLPHARKRQCSLDREADLARVAQFTFGDRVLDAHHFLRRKGAVHVATIGHEVTPEAPQSWVAGARHRQSHPPEAPPPPKPPPPPEKPPPPPPPPPPPQPPPPEGIH